MNRVQFITCFLVLIIFSETIICSETGLNEKDCNQHIATDLLLPMLTPPIEHSSFCTSADYYKDHKDLLEQYKFLELYGVFDSNNCIKNSERNGPNAELIGEFIKKNLEIMPINFLATVDHKANQMSIHYRVSSLKDYANTHLTSKDKIQIATISTASIIAGALISERIYKGEKDKRGHWILGATASGIATGGTYLLLETASLGDQLGLTKKQKKTAIMLSGPIVGLLVGIAKEIYDHHHPANHTVDPNDVFATSLGAGAMVPLVIDLNF